MRNRHVQNLAKKLRSRNKTFKGLVSVKPLIRQKMPLLENATIQCPYCWQEIEIEIDCTLQNQEYIENCQICCKPITLKITTNENAPPTIETLTEND